MNIQKVKLRGFIGVKKGMGLDEIEIDFSGLNGLIGIWGKTGAGKTSIFENLHPYPMLVSRPQPALKNHVFLRDSVKELSFIHNGNLYETLVKVDAESGRSEGFVKVNGTSVVNGKISEYSKYIERLFGSPTLFFNSVFCAQNSTKISGLRPAELKALFAEFLGPRLDKLVGYESASKQRISAVSGMMDGIERDIQRQRAVVEKYEDAVSELATKTSDLQFAEREIGFTRQSLDDAEKSLDGEKKNLVEQEKAQARIKDLRESLASVQKEVTDLETRAEAELSVIRQKAQAAGREIEGLKATLKDADTITAAAGRAKELTGEIAKVEADLSAAQETAEEAKAELHKAEMDSAEASRIAQEKRTKLNDKLTFVKGRVSDFERIISDKERDIKALDSDPELARIHAAIHHYTEQTQALDAKDPACQSTTCSFIVGALKAKELLIDLDCDLEHRTQEVDRLREAAEAARDGAKEKLEALNTQAHALQMEHTDTLLAAQEAADERRKAINNLGLHARQAADKAETLKAELHSLKQSLILCQNLSERLPEIKEAEASLKAVQTRFDELVSEGTLKKSGWDQAIGAKKEQADSLSRQIFEAEAKLDPAVQRKISTLEISITNIKEAIEKTQERISTLRAEVNTLERAAAERAVAEKELERLISEKKRLTTELSEWAYIKDACGANGLRALEIEAVAPSITHDANQLLEQAFGAWAMVDFRTQTDDGKEVLEPRVIDQDGDSVLIGNRSGGQQVWALKALRLAMTMISKEKSGCDFLTAYADEDDAGLDVETAKSFTRLYQVFMGLGGFDKCFMITHKRECVELADHVLMLGDGGVTVQ